MVGIAAAAYHRNDVNLGSGIYGPYQAVSHDYQVEVEARQKSDGILNVSARADREELRRILGELNITP